VDHKKVLEEPLALYWGI